jgi:hypothetical protein
VGALKRRAAPAAAVAARQEPSAQRRDSRLLPVGKDHGGGRQRARLGPRQEGGREKAPPALVDTEGLVLKAKVHSAKVLDQDGFEAAVGVGTGQALAPAASVGRRRIPREEQEVDRGGPWA